MRSATPLESPTNHRYADPFGWAVRGVLWVLGTALLVLLLANGQPSQLDHRLYDWQMRHWTYDPGDAVIIVAIDARSLAALGRWPWPRSVHARLIDRLTADDVRGIGMDVTLAEPDRANPANDALLAKAVARNGHVVMPVFAEAQALGGMLEEIQSIPIIDRSVTTLGHVDVAMGADRVARGAWLKAGLGEPYWPALALAVQRIGQRADAPLPGLHDRADDPRSPYLWERNDYVLLRYAGPAGSFGRVSYIDVLDGAVPAAMLKGKRVLVGATAEGMGDIIDTPDGPMPGVEYQANLLESLRRGITLLPLNLAGRCLLGAAMLTLPLLLYGLPGLRRTWRASLLAMALCLLASLLLLRLAHLWWPPGACIVLILAGAVLWSLRGGLDAALRHRAHRRHAAAAHSAANGPAA